MAVGVLMEYFMAETLIIIGAEVINAYFPALLQQQFIWFYLRVEKVQSNNKTTRETLNALGIIL